MLSAFLLAMGMLCIYLEINTNYIYPLSGTGTPVSGTGTLSEGLILSKHKEYSLISLCGITIEVE